MFGYSWTPRRLGSRGNRWLPLLWRAIFAPNHLQLAGRDTVWVLSTYLGMAHKHSITYIYMVQPKMHCSMVFTRVCMCIISDDHSYCLAKCKQNLWVYCCCLTSFGLSKMLLLNIIAVWWAYCHFNVTKKMTISSTIWILCFALSMDLTSCIYILPSVWILLSITLCMGMGCNDQSKWAGEPTRSHVWVCSRKASMPTFISSWHCPS